MPTSPQPPGRPLLPLRATFDWALIFGLRTPHATPAFPKLPPEIEPYTEEGWAFWNVTIGEAVALRPGFVPFAVGAVVHLAAYHLYSRFHPPSGPPVEGLFTLRIDCDSPSLARWSRRLSAIPWILGQIDVADDRAGTVEIDIDIPQAPVHAVVDTRRRPALGAGSPFAGLREAAQALKCPQRTFAWNPADNRLEVRPLSRKANDTNHRLIHVVEGKWGLLHDADVHTEICYDAHALEYAWPVGTSHTLR